MDLPALSAFLTDNKYPAFRARQIIKNYYSGRYTSFDQMTDLPKVLRDQLIANFNVLSVTPIQTYDSPHTQKTVLQLADGLKIETVLMDYDGWLTACISSQVGCALGCTFCATGKMGLKRNLTMSEIIDQIIYWNTKLYPKYIGRVVFMGMGEPFMNWDNVFAAIKHINDKDGLNIGQRKMSISTAGLADKIIDFANLNTQINLAVSLHSADQVSRAQLMPIARKFDLKTLKKACEIYTHKTNRQLFFEYALIRDKNDTQSHLDDIIEFMGNNRLFFLNIIPLNPIPNGLPPSDQPTLSMWEQQLTCHHVNFSFRRTFGQNIAAACGQLATSN